jgi:osmotically inducible protein OsmC
MSQNTRVLYTSQTHTTGGRKSGVARSSDGVLDIRLAMPGSATIGANPEQLLAAGWSASLLTIVTLEAGKNNIALPTGVGIDTEIDLCLEGGTHFLRARFNIGLLGVERGVARALVTKAFESCPYSRATRGNVEIAIKLAWET